MPQTIQLLKEWDNKWKKVARTSFVIFWWFYPFALHSIVSCLCTRLGRICVFLFIFSLLFYKSLVGLSLKPSFATICKMKYYLFPFLFGCNIYIVMENPQGNLMKYGKYVLDPAVELNSSINHFAFSLCNSNYLKKNCFKWNINKILILGSFVSYVTT